MRLLNFSRSKLITVTAACRLITARNNNKDFALAIKPAWMITFCGNPAFIPSVIALPSSLAKGIFTVMPTIQKGLIAEVAGVVD